MHAFGHVPDARAHVHVWVATVLVCIITAEVVFLVGIHVNTLRDRRRQGEAAHTVAAAAALPRAARERRPLPTVAATFDHGVGARAARKRPLVIIIVPEHDE